MFFRGNRFLAARGDPLVADLLILCNKILNLPRKAISSALSLGDHVLLLVFGVETCNVAEFAFFVQNCALVLV